MFHMTNDSHLFRTAAQLEIWGVSTRSKDNRWKKGEGALPASVPRPDDLAPVRPSSQLGTRQPCESTHNPYFSEPVSETQHADPDFLPQAQYWVPADNVETALPESRGYTLGFRDIARPTDVRTMIASIAPGAGYGNTLPAASRTRCARLYLSRS